MKTFFRKTLLVVILSVMPSVIWAYDTCVDGIYYNLNSKDYTASVTYRDYTKNSYSGSVTIPEKIGIYKVTSIGERAFYGCTGLTDVTIPNSVTSIGEWAFYGCTGLTDVTIPNSVTSIGEMAFSDCTGLTSITMNSVTSIGERAFSDCTGLTSITMNSVTSIGERAFYGCTGLTSITMNSVTSIGKSAFSGCTGLTAITMNSVTSIGEMAFFGCTGLTAITIPYSVTSIGEYAFEGCIGMNTLVFNASNCAPFDVKSYTTVFPETISNVIIGNSVRVIPDNFLKKNKIIQEVAIPNSVTSIGEMAFYDCTGLTSITMNSVTSIGKSAFYGCTGLTSITMNSVTYIGSEAFLNCTGLTSINIPSSVTYIGSEAFQGCSKIETLEFNAENCAPFVMGFQRPSVFPKTISNVIIGNSVRVIPGNFLYGNNTIKEITISSSVTSIGGNAFYGCTGLTSIDILGSVTSIGGNAFYGCTGLTSIDILGSVTSIGGNAFYGCTGLTSIDILGSVTSIGGNAFYGCTGLTSIDIPGSVTNIGSGAFYGCTGLTSIIIPGSVTNIGSGAFANCSKLNKIVLYAKLDNYDIFPSNNDYKVLYIYESEKEKIKYWYGKIILLENPYVITPIHQSIFGLSFKLADNEYCLEKAINTNVSISNSENESWTVIPDENGLYVKDGLEEHTKYQINVSVDTDKGTARIITEDIYTDVGSASATYKATQTTITITGVYKKTDSTCKDIVCGVEFNGQEYVYEGKDITFYGLKPNSTHYIYPFAYYGEHRIIGNNYQYKTKSLSPKASGIQGPTTNIITGSYVNGDAHVSETGFTGTLLGKDGVKGDRLNLSGLEPGKEYTVSYYVKTEEGSNETTNYTFTTPALELTTLQPKSVSNTCAIIAAETNIADEETNVGFQWKKYDAPSTLKPSEGYAAIYSGMMEGRVKNLQPTSYYNVRAFYKSAAGNYHYGEWVTFDPSDFSYFEPTVHTYPVEEASDGSYNVKGYALAGTDDITEQGFQYGEVGASESKAMRVRAAMSENGLITVLAKGQVMTATLKDLKPSTTYVCRAFVVTAGGTTYGEEQIFTTKGNTTGIDTAVTGQKKPEITGYYDLSGHRIDAPCKGVSIIRYSDGSARKVVVK